MLLKSEPDIIYNDAFQITVALAAGCKPFLTNDVTFKRVTKLRVLVLNDFNTFE